MRKYWPNNKAKLLLIIAVVYSSVNCSKVNNHLGDNFISDRDQLTMVIDTITGFDLYTKSVDSFRVDLNDYVYLGSYVSPALGRLDITYTTEIATSLAASEIILDDYILDSVTLNLNFSCNIGNPNSLIDVSMYELETNFRKPMNTVFRDFAPEGYFDPYYSNFDYKKYIKDTPLINFKIDIAEVLRNENKFSIKLPIELGERLMKVVPDNYLQDSSMRKIFKGFCFIAKPTYAGGAVITINPSYSNIIFEMYDKKKYEKNKEKSYIHPSMDFLHYDKKSNELYSQAVTTVNIDKEYANEEFSIPNSILNDSLTNYDYSYVTGMGNAITSLRFPLDELNTLKDQLTSSFSSAIIVTNAMLILPIEQHSISSLNNALSSLVPFYEFSTPIYGPDYYLTSNGTIFNGAGGLINRSKNYYEMNITSTIQNILNNRTKYKSLDIGPADISNFTDNIVKLDNKENNPIFLKLTYCIAK